TDSLDFEEMDVTEMFEDATNGKSLSEFINEQASELSGEDLQLTDDDIKVILNNKAVKSFLEDKLSDYAAFIAGDDKEANAALSSDELYSLIEDNKGVIESATGKKLDDKAMDKIRTGIDNLELEKLDAQTLVGDELKDVRDAVSTVRKLLPGLLG
ncbi:MAG: hypothetical protein J6Y20_06325, partial [Lachnospiraceae bacterium]|nr:hypothetical protein [Lachnospiraceae bacterium]